MPPSTAVSFRIPPDKAEQLEALAKQTDRPRSWLLEQALDAYLEAHAWQVRHIREGLAELRRGEHVAHEEVVDWLATWGSASGEDGPE